ncbi:two pore calcium channel protein 2-like [Strongylocentrotus purpuratus]|uniref:Ion transport domain-containing protein n=1 Tax=Strongylocentrotus purpuratus TaxID=7668 RepID=A0A7M7PIY7_STRPU|nr:two pore calcium channel protein 2-like [Strongylocentrotus purpuratus]
MGDYYEYESDDNDDQKQPIHRKVYPIYGRDRERSSAPSDSSTYLTGSSSASANALMNFDSDSHCDPKALLQAVVFVEDAVKFRSIKHKIDPFSLWYYRVYYSRPIQWTLYLAIFTILVLAFFEPPSSLTTGSSSDPRYRGDRIHAPCGVTEGIEFACLLIFLYDVCTKIYLIGFSELRKSKWLVAYLVVMAFSLIDWLVTINFVCDELYRIRRFLRPFFLIQNSQLMKKTVRSIKNTMPKVASVILLLLIHIYFFTMFGMLLFPRPDGDLKPSVLHNKTSNQTSLIVNDTTIVDSRIFQEGMQHFASIGESFMSLLVLLTTANNPDVTMPAYQNNRFYALYFIIFLGIGLYLFFNMLTAVIYNEFRGYLITSMQSSHFRRRLGFQAAFEMLRAQIRTVNGSIERCTVSVSVVKSVVLQASIPKRAKRTILTELDGNIGGVITSSEFQGLFDCLDHQTDEDEIPGPRLITRPRLKRLQSCIVHRFFGYCGTAVAVVNIVFISIEISTQYDKSLYHDDSELTKFNIVFIIYYCVEQILKFWALGWKCFKYSVTNLLDALFTAVLLVAQILYLVMEGSRLYPDDSVGFVMYDLVRIINILITFRLFRIITHFNTMAIVVSTMLDLIRNLRAFIGILVVIYYVFAILGMVVFRGKSPQPPNNTDITQLPMCGSYQQLNYYANNFDDFASAIVVLWDIMVVNNWHVFLEAYSKTASQWSQIYFIAWYFTSVLVCLNVFTAIILENFITSWDRSQKRQRQSLEEGNRPTAYLMSVHTMFRDDLQEPTESELLDEIYKHPHIQNLRF